MTENDRARRTVESLAKPTTVPHLGIEKADALVVLGGGIVGTFVAVYLQLQLLTIPVIVLGLVAGGLILYAKPSTLTGTDYLRLLGRFLRIPSRITRNDTGSTTEAGPIREWITLSKDAREATAIERYLPGAGVIERDDGQLVGGLKLVPQEMDFAEPTDWLFAADTVEQFVNDELSYPIQLYATSRSFPVEDHLAPLEDRLSDPDVQSNPTMEAVIEDVVATRKQRLEEANPSPVHYYLLTEVGEDDILTETIGEPTGLEKLAGIPLLGIPFRLFVTRREGLTEEKKYDRMIDELGRRLSTIAAGWPEPIEGADSHRLSIAEWLPLLEEFWQGTTRDSPAPGMVRTRPYVSGEDPDVDPEAVADATSLQATVEDDNSVQNQSPIHEHNDAIGFGVTRDGDDLRLTADPAGSQTNPDDANPNSESASTTETAGAAGTTLPDRATLQQSAIAPDGLAPGFETIDVGTDTCQVLYVPPGGWPDTVAIGALRRLLTRPDIEFDLSVQIDPLEPDTARTAAETRFKSLKADAGIEDDELTADDKLSAAGEVKNFYEQVKEGQRPFEVSLYVVARAEDEDALRECSQELRSEFATPPADLTLRTAKGEQLRALRSASPIGVDILRSRGTTDPTELLLGRGVAALLASLKDSGRLDEQGIELGRHAHNGKPILFDPFATDKNYNWVIVGDSGAGKTYSSAAMGLRTWARNPDTTLIFIDPMQNFEGLAQALDAEIARVGGDQTLNPLEIRPPSESTGEYDHDPLRGKIQDVLSLFDNYAYQQGIDDGLGEARGILASAIKEAYHRADITHDVRTHDRPSPTIPDVFDVLADMAENPAEVVVRTEEEAALISDAATNLLTLLRPFVDGQHEHMAGRSEFEIGDSDVVYLDMSEEEGRWGGGGGLLMQLVFSLVYERAKATPDNVVIVIDEARFFMRHSENLSFLGQRVRHSRHFNTSIRFVTQELNDFFAHDEAEAIWNNSAVKWFHTLDEIDQWQDTFGLNDTEVSFIEDAEQGEVGYSEALVSINDRRFPVQVSATPAEDALIDFDVRTDSHDDLPGASDAVPEAVREFQENLEADSNEPALSLDPATQEQLQAVWDDLRAPIQGYAEVLNCRERYAFLTHVDEADADPEAVIARMVAKKLEVLIPGIDAAGIRESIREGLARDGDNGQIDATGDRSQAAHTDGGTSAERRHEAAQHTEQASTGSTGWQPVPTESESHTSNTE